MAGRGEYYGGYLIEKSLSIDNVFAWAVIFSFFEVPNRYQFRVLFWGVFAALVLRAEFIFAGVALLDRFEWLLYVFGAILLYTAFRMVTSAGEEVDPERNIALRTVRRFLPVTDELDGQKMFTRRDGALMATPLFAVLVLIEFTDVIFAVDSVPAILAAILTFVGIEMLLVEAYHLPIYLDLGVITLILTVAIVTSLRAEAKEDEAAELLSTAFVGPSKRRRKKDQAAPRPPREEEEGVH